MEALTPSLWSQYAEEKLSPRALPLNDTSEEAIQLRSLIRIPQNKLILNKHNEKPQLQQTNKKEKKTFSLYLYNSIRNKLALIQRVPPLSMSPHFLSLNSSSSE